jgi:hypothetical protein
MADTRIYPSERSCSEKESTLKTIATCDLRKEDVPQFDQVPASAIPSNTWTTVALRYFLYCWQRIGNNQGELKPAAIDNIQAALRILHSKT